VNPSRRVGECIASPSRRAGGKGPGGETTKKTEKAKKKRNDRLWGGKWISKQQNSDPGYPKRCREEKGPGPILARGENWEASRSSRTMEKPITRKWYGEKNRSRGQYLVEAHDMRRCQKKRITDGEADRLQKREKVISYDGVPVSWLMDSTKPR